MATGEPFISYATRKLVKPLGMEAVSWETDMGQGATGPVTNIYAAKSCAHDMARFALFLERGGAWNGKQLVSKSYFKAATSPSQAMNRAYGYLIWLNAEPGHNAGGQIQGNRFGPAPRDTISAIGAEGQYATAIPSLDLCLVRQGDTSPDPAAPIRFINEVVWSLKGSAAPDTQTSMPAT